MEMKWQGSGLVNVSVNQNVFFRDIQGVSGGIVNILGGGSADYSE
jgi:hypothetical protein